METLLKESVSPAKEGEEPLTVERQADLLTILDHDWQVVDHHHLTKEYQFKDFMTALDFVNQVGQYAEEVNHHPEITFTWGRAEVTIYTHDVGGLRRDDFVWAANVEQIYQVSLDS